MKRKKSISLSDIDTYRWIQSAEETFAILFLLLQKMYSMEFPTDISDFWNFCCSKSPLNPLKALAEGGLLLVGEMMTMIVKLIMKAMFKFC